MAEKMFQVVVTCRCDSWELIAKEFMDIYGYCNMTVTDQGETIAVAGPYTNVNPTTCKGNDLELFCDAVRNYANYGWPEYDPLRVYEVPGCYTDRMVPAMDEDEGMTETIKYNEDGKAISGRYPWGK